MLITKIMLLKNDHLFFAVFIFNLYAKNGLLTCTVCVFLGRKMTVINFQENKNLKNGETGRTGN